VVVIVNDLLIMFAILLIKFTLVALLWLGHCSHSMSAHGPNNTSRGATHLPDRFPDYGTIELAPILRGRRARVTETIPL
jgi:hypothetical protein